jgi:hypothetical protein
MLLADGLWNAIDPSVPVPNSAVQMRAWASNNLKAHGILFLTLSQAVKDKITNTGIGINGHLLWATLESYYTTADLADKFLQAVITAEFRLTAIAVSLPPHMVQDKILGSLSSAYFTIVTHLQLESPQRDISAMINAINAWERADLQRHDSVIATAHVNQDVYYANQGG